MHIVGRSRKARILLDRDYVVESQTIADKTFSQKQPEGSFSQPNGAMCEKMVSWAEKQTRGSKGDLLELYCGNGNFTIPLATNFRRVVATEVPVPWCQCCACDMLHVQRSYPCCCGLSVVQGELWRAWAETIPCMRSATRIHAKFIVGSVKNFTGR